MKVLAALFIVLSLMTGCVQYVQINPQKTSLGTDRVFNKNYQTGQVLSAYVGQPIIKVKDYRITRLNAKHMRATSDFVVSGGLAVPVTGYKDVDYIVIGDTTIEDRTYTVIRINQWQGLLIKDDGSVHNRVLNFNYLNNYTFTISPPDLRFIGSKNEVIDVDSGYLNYELLYGGTDGKSFTVTYREYTSNDLARPAFYQNLIYEVGKKQIRFRDTSLVVHEVTNEKIVFMVVSDGLEK